MKTITAGNAVAAMFQNTEQMPHHYKAFRIENFSGVRS